MGKQNRRNRCLRLCCAGDCGRTVIKKHAALAGLVSGIRRRYAVVDDDVWNLRTSVSRGQSEIAVDRYAAVFLSDRMLAAAGL